MFVHILKCLLCFECSHAYSAHNALIMFNNDDYHACALILWINFHGFFCVLSKYFAAHRFFSVVENYNLIYTLKSILILNLLAYAPTFVPGNGVRLILFFSPEINSVFFVRFVGIHAVKKSAVLPINYRKHYLHV